MAEDGARGWTMALAAAQRACPEIREARWNDYAGAHYASAGDIVGQLRAVLHEAGLVVFEGGSEPVGDVLEVAYIVAHAESGHERSFVHRMALAQKQLGDKAVSAARTVGMRDFLRGLLIPHLVDQGPAQGAPRSRGQGQGQGHGRQPPPRPQGQGQGQGQGQRHSQTTAARPVSVAALPLALAAGDWLGLDDLEAYALTSLPVERGPGLAVFASRHLGFDLAAATDQARGQALDALRRQSPKFQEAIHQYAIEGLIQALASMGAKDLPDRQAIMKLTPAELLGARRALERRIKGQAWGWQIGPCNSCSGKATLVKNCAVCEGAGHIRSPKPRPVSG